MPRIPYRPGRSLVSSPFGCSRFVCSRLRPNRASLIRLVQSANQNVFAPIIGPPDVNPYWFDRYSPFLMLARLAKKSLAFSASLRWNSHTDPRSWLVPDLSVVLSTAPPARPYSALKELVRILISSTASTGGLTIYATPLRKS